MATLYVANCTHQHHEFQYRLPEMSQKMALRKSIPAGKGVEFKDLEGPSLASLIRQIERAYGAVDEKNIDRARGQFIGVCYSTDKPVTAKTIEKGAHHNTEVLELEGHERRVASAVATAAAMAVATNTAAVTLEVEVTEQPNSLAESKPLMTDKIRVEAGAKGATRPPTKIKRRA